MKGKKVCFAFAVCLLCLLAPTSTAAARPYSVLSASNIDPAHFVRYVTNSFFPLKPGTTFFYKGTKDGAPTTTIVSVSQKTKRILGVLCTVVHDQAFEDGVLVEDTYDWYAQDDQGNVWYFGEATKELDPRGKVTSTEGSWEAGVNGAQPGIIMKAHPHVGDRYRQEFLRGVAEDMAQVLRLEDNAACVPYGCFDDLLQTREWTPLEPNVTEHKYYAEGVGFVLSVMVRGGRERSQLVRVTSSN